MATAALYLLSQYKHRFDLCLGNLTPRLFRSPFVCTQLPSMSLLMAFNAQIKPFLLCLTFIVLPCCVLIAWNYAAPIIHGCFYVPDLFRDEVPCIMGFEHWSSPPADLQFPLVCNQLSIVLKWPMPSNLLQTKIHWMSAAITLTPGNTMNLIWLMAWHPCCQYWNVPVKPIRSLYCSVLWCLQ